MAKLTREQKIELYKKRKQGETVSSLSKEYQIRSDNIKYLVRLIDRHGFDILRRIFNGYLSRSSQTIVTFSSIVDFSFFELQHAAFLSIHSLLLDTDFYFQDILFFLQVTYLHIFY